MRRLRAILFTATLWATAWGIGTVVFLGLVWLFNQPLPLSSPLLRLAFRTSLLAAATGALGGAAFAVALMVAERNWSLQTLSRIRMAIWGALGGAALPAALMIVMRALPGFQVAGLPGLWGVLLVGGAFGATLTTTHLTLARRLPSDPRVTAFPPHHSPS
jgi:hypothetical protein